MLPFTSDQFFEVFATYNRTVWPVQWLLWLVGLATLAGAIVRSRVGSRVAFFGLSGLWLWMAFAYHLAFFARINPAARVFAIGFAAAGGLFAWRALRGGPPELELHRHPRDLVGLLLATFGLILYPLISLRSGHPFPAAPGFGLPCPTTLFTIGVLTLGKPRADRVLLIVPLAWSVIGSSAAFLLGVRQDLSLIAGAAWCAWLIARPSPGARSVPDPDQGTAAPRA